MSKKCVVCLTSNYCFLFVFREQNIRLVPLLLKRLRRLQSSTDFAQHKTESSPSHSETTRPFAHLNNASPPYRNSEQRLTTAKSKKYFLVVKTFVTCITIPERENGVITPLKRTASMLSPNRAEPEPHTPSKEDSSAVSIGKHFNFYCAK